MEKNHAFHRYETLHQLASGGMADVFLAKHIGIADFERLVVLKRIRPSFQQDPAYIQMFLNEARMSAYLSHSNIAQVFSVGEDEEGYFIEMEFLRGQDVSKLWKRALSRNEAIPLQHVLNIVMDVCSGLDYAHTQTGNRGDMLDIVHCDVSPHNIFITYDGEIKILDFGIAKAKLHRSEALEGVLQGKSAYMSPEHKALQLLDHRSDQYSVGVVLYELTTMSRFSVCGGMPYFPLGYPKELKTIILRCLCEKPENRFLNCKHLREALEEICVVYGWMHSPARLGAYVRALFEKEYKESAVKDHAMPLRKANWVSLHRVLAARNHEAFSRMGQLFGMGVFSFVVFWWLGICVVYALDKNRGADSMAALLQRVVTTMKRLLLWT